MESSPFVSAQQKFVAICPWLLIVLFWGAGLFELSQLAHLSLFYSTAGISSDEGLYFAMGRGLLNRLHFYIDLFETKPPMVFWLGALSLLTTGGDSLYRVLQVIGLVSIPVALALFTIQSNRGYPLVARLITGGVAFLFGAALATYAVTRSIGAQTEGFGIVPATFALLLFAWNPVAPRARHFRIVAIALCVCLAVLTKEPFAVALLAGFLLLATSKHDWSDALRAVGLGALLWLLFLITSGVAHGYFAVYLPEMFSGRVTQNVLYHNYASGQMFVVHSPIWTRGFNFFQLFLDMWHPSYPVVPLFPFLALALGVLFLAHPASIGGDDRRWRWFALGVVTMALATLTCTRAFDLGQVLEFSKFKLPTDPFFMRVYVFTSLAALSCIVSFSVLVRYALGTAQRVAFTSAALYLAMLAVATGGDFEPQHFLFAVPVCIALFASLVRRASLHSTEGFTMALLAIVGGILILNSHVVGQRYNWPAMETAQAEARSGRAEMLPKARQLDALLTACGDARYFFTGDSIGQLPTLTFHSPYQLQYGLLRADSQRNLYFTDGQPNPYFHAKLVHDFAETQILVLDAQSAADFPYPDLRQQYLTSFSSDPPACAGPYLPIPGVPVFFRH